MHTVHHHKAPCAEQLALDLDEIARQGAQRMLAHALQAEVDAYLKAAKASATSMGMPSSSGTATTTNASYSAEPARSTLGLRGSMTGE